ncbi:hypothetical protein D3C81_425570 [compost metagenome]
MWQPEVEGKLRAFAQGAEEDQGEQDGIQGMIANQLAGSEDLVQVIAANHMAEQQHPRQQAQTASTGDHQGHVGTATGIGAVMPVANQQERENAGQLPEEYDLDQVAGDHQAEHCAHERQEKGEEPWHRVLGRHVVARIQRHQSADTQHQQGEQPGKAVHAQYQVQAQARQPEKFFADHTTVGDLRVQQGYLDGTDQSDEPGKQRLAVAGVVRQDSRQAAADERQKQ